MFWYFMKTILHRDLLIAAWHAHHEIELFANQENVMSSRKISSMKSQKREWRGGGDRVNCQPPYDTSVFTFSLHSLCSLNVCKMFNTWPRFCSSPFLYQNTIKNNDKINHYTHVHNQLSIINRHCKYTSNIMFFNNKPMYKPTTIKPCTFTISNSNKN